MKYLLSVILFALTFTFSNLALAGNEGGGGNMVLIDGSWTLQDYFGPYVQPGRPFRLQGAPSEAFRTVLQMLSVYSHHQPPTLRTLLIEALIKNAEFRYVEKLPCKDTSDGNAVMYGCTVDGVTYLIEKEFSKLSNEDRIFALLHERLHDVKKSKDDHQWILPYVYTARTLYDYLTRQLGGDQTELLPSEIKLIKQLITFNDQVFLDSGSHTQTVVTAISPHGGTLLEMTGNTTCIPMDEERALSMISGSFLSVGSALTQYNCSGAGILRSQILLSYVLATSIQDSQIKNSYIVNLAHARGVFDGSIKNSEITDSSVLTKNLTYHDEPQITDSKAIGIAISNSKIYQSDIDVRTMVQTYKGKPLVKICNVTIKDLDYSELGDDAEYENCN